jgi:hypothetical protein
MTRGWRIAGTRLGRKTDFTLFQAKKQVLAGWTDGKSGFVVLSGPICFPFV